MIKLVYVTGNKDKVAAAKKCMADLDVEIIQKNIDVPEIQADTNEEVANFSSKYASNVLKEDCVKNDGGLVIPALNGFPGPYAKYVEYTLGEQGILDLMVNKTDRTAYWIEAWSYTEYGKDPVCFIGKFYGKISTEIKGNNGYGYDKIFIPEGKDITLAEMSNDEKLLYWCSTAHKDLIDYIKKAKNID
ncbi:MAG: non-canonical purine NTP pyrophosphatase [Clostridia bacterium]|nr:non-canonical purine NTP pyrophosphatase [Clostridia bacterium]